MTDVGDEGRRTTAEEREAPATKGGDELTSNSRLELVEQVAKAVRKVADMAAASSAVQSKPSQNHTSSDSNGERINNYGDGNAAITTHVTTTTTPLVPVSMETKKNIEKRENGTGRTSNSGEAASAAQLLQVQSLNDTLAEQKRHRDLLLEQKRDLQSRIQQALDCRRPPQVAAPAGDGTAVPAKCDQASSQAGDKKLGEMTVGDAMEYLEDEELEDEECLSYEESALLEESCNCIEG